MPANEMVQRIAELECARSRELHTKSKCQGAVDGRASLMFRIPASTDSHD